MLCTCNKDFQYTNWSENHGKASTICHRKTSKTKRIYHSIWCFTAPNINPEAIYQNRASFELSWAKLFVALYLNISALLTQRISNTAIIFKKGLTVHCSIAVFTPIHGNDDNISRRHWKSYDCWDQWDFRSTKCVTFGDAHTFRCQ